MTTIYQDNCAELGHRKAFEIELKKDYGRDSNYKKWSDAAVVAAEWEKIREEEK